METEDKMSDVIETFADGTITKRSFTAQEIEQNKKDKTATELNESNRIATEETKAAAHAKLAALGLPPEEIKAL